MCHLPVFGLGGLESGVESVVALNDDLIGSGVKIIRDEMSTIFCK
jgi:hypothetical protein